MNDYNKTKPKTKNESKPKNQNTKESQNTRERTKKNRGTLQIEQQYLGFDKQLAVKKKKRKIQHLIATYLPTYIISYIPLQRQTVKKKGERFTSATQSPLSRQARLYVKKPCRLGQVGTNEDQKVEAGNHE
jgi:hypothetical protein